MVLPARGIVPQPLPGRTSETPIDVAATLAPPGARPSWRNSSSRFWRFSASQVSSCRIIVFLREPAVRPQVRRHNRLQVDKNILAAHLEAKHVRESLICPRHHPLLEILGFDEAGRQHPKGGHVNPLRELRKDVDQKILDHGRAGKQQLVLRRASLATVEGTLGKGSTGQPLVWALPGAVGVVRKGWPRLVGVPMAQWD